MIFNNIFPDMMPPLKDVGTITKTLSLFLEKTNYTPKPPSDILFILLPIPESIKINFKKLDANSVKVQKVPFNSPIMVDMYKKYFPAEQKFFPKGNTKVTPKNYATTLEKFFYVINHAPPIEGCGILRSRPLFKTEVVYGEHGKMCLDDIYLLKIEVGGSTYYIWPKVLIIPAGSEHTAFSVRGDRVIIRHRHFSQMLVVNHKSPNYIKILHFMLDTWVSQQQVALACFCKLVGGTL